MSATTIGSKRPIIGVSCSHTNSGSLVSRNYTESIIQAGGIPLAIPVSGDSVLLREVLQGLDAVVLIGGGDVHPSYYGEEMLPECGRPDSLRDRYDLLLIRTARDMCMPMLGICRGHQLINVAFGGTLYQDIPSQLSDTTVNHYQTEPSSVATHRISICPESTLAAVVGDTQMNVNSFHHQGVKKVAPGFKATAWTEDSIVEAIEAKHGLPIMGVQFHPEALSYRGGDSVAARIFRHLVEKAKTYKHAVDLHRNNVALDSHADTPLDFARGARLGERSKNILVSIPRMEEGRLSAQYLACWVRQGELTDSGRQAAYQRIEQLLDSCYSHVAQNEAVCGIAVTPEDLAALKAEGKLAFFLGVENAYGVGNDLNVLNHYADRGVSYVTLCHTKNNDVCDSSSDRKGERWGGLSPFGKKVVKRMNELGLVIDLSHASEGTFWDVVKYSKAPVVCTHSSAKVLCDHDRNLTDDQLRAIARTGGVVQACPVSNFIRKDHRNASIDDFMKHINYMINVAGIDHVGIGSDFDGGGGVSGFYGCNELLNVTMRLIEAGYSDSDIAKLLGGNYLRVLADTQKLRKK